MRRALSCLFVSLLLLGSVWAGPEEEATAIVKRTIDAIRQILVEEREKAGGGDGARPDTSVRDQRVMDVLSPVSDFPLMAKLTLGREHWPALDEAGRERFTDLFIETLKRSFIGKVELVLESEITFDPAVVEKNKVQVPTRSHTQDEDVAVLYKMYAKDGTWKVYDVEIDGVSIVKSYGSQYNEIIVNEGIDALIPKMEEQLRAAPEGGE